MPVGVELVNDGKESVRIAWGSRDPMKVDIELTAKDGARVPLTRYGKKTLEPTDLLDQRYQSAGSIRTPKVKPGERRNLSVPNLALLYDLTLPGEYVLTVVQSVEWGRGADVEGDPTPRRAHSTYHYKAMTAARNDRRRIRSAADLLKNPLLRRAVNAGGFVYFVSDGVNIKIGLTRTGVAGRVRSLQTGASAELTVLAVLPGADREAELHRRFRHLHVRGEWFRPVRTCWRSSSQSRNQI